MFDIRPALEKLNSKLGRTYPADSFIFKEGDQGDEVFFIYSGQVQISTIYDEELQSEHIMTVLRETDIFGEMAVLDNTERSATARAITEVRVIVFQKDQFLTFMQRYPALVHKLLQTIGDYVRRQDKKLKKALRMLSYQQ